MSTLVSCLSPAYRLPVLAGNAVLHGREIKDAEMFSRILFHVGTVIDKQVFGTLPNYSDAEIVEMEQPLKWISVNPDIFTFLVSSDMGGVVGYLTAMPLADTFYQKIKDGFVLDNEVSERDIIPFRNGETVRIYLMSIAIDERYRTCGEGLFESPYVQLINAFLEKMTFYFKDRQVKVTHMLATAWTPQGLRGCRSMGMRSVGKDRFCNPVYEIEIDSIDPNNKRIMPTLRKLASLYRG